MNLLPLLEPIIDSSVERYESSPSTFLSGVIERSLSLESVSNLKGIIFLKFTLMLSSF